MEQLAGMGGKVQARSLGWSGLAWVGGALATAAAIGVGAVLAVIFAATAVVMGLMALTVIGLGGVAYRARKVRRPADDPTIIEARNVGGHSWVAYGWDRRGR